MVTLCQPRLPGMEPMAELAAYFRSRSEVPQADLVRLAAAARAAGSRWEAIAAACGVQARKDAAGVICQSYGLAGETGAELLFHATRRAVEEFTGSRRYPPLRSRPSERQPYGRGRLPRTVSPTPAAAGLRRNVPRCRAARAGLGRQRRARCTDRWEKVTGTRAGTPRIVRVGPSSLNGVPHPRSARTRLRRAVDPGASDTPVRSQGPGTSLPGPDAGQPLHDVGTWLICTPEAAQVMAR
jgi:hypothetical protein